MLVMIEAVNRAPAMPRSYRLDEVIKAADAIDHAVASSITEFTADAVTALDDIERTCQESGINASADPESTVLWRVFHRAGLRDIQVIQY